MPIEKSAGAVVFKKKNDKIKYLLLKYPGTRGKPHWGFPRGGIEKGETLKQTAKREIKEETGIEKIKFIEDFSEWIKFFFKHEGETVMKIATFLLAETEQKKVKLSHEHTDYKWLSYKEAKKIITFENSKQILKKANQFLLNKKL